MFGADRRRYARCCRAVRAACGAEAAVRSRGSLELEDDRTSHHSADGQGIFTGRASTVSRRPPSEGAPILLRSWLYCQFPRARPDFSRSDGGAAADRRSGPDGLPPVPVESGRSGDRIHKRDLSAAPPCHPYFCGPGWREDFSPASDQQAAFGSALRVPYGQQGHRFGGRSKGIDRARKAGRGTGDLRRNLVLDRPACRELRGPGSGDAAPNQSLPGQALREPRPGAASRAGIHKPPTQLLNLDARKRPAGEFAEGAGHRSNDLWPRLRPTVSRSPATSIQLRGDRPAPPATQRGLVIDRCNALLKLHRPRRPSMGHTCPRPVITHAAAGQKHPSKLAMRQGSEDASTF